MYVRLCWFVVVCEFDVEVLFVLFLLATLHSNAPKEQAMVLICHCCGYTSWVNERLLLKPISLIISVGIGGS